MQLQLHASFSFIMKLLLHDARLAIAGTNMLPSALSSCKKQASLSLFFRWFLAAAIAGAVAAAPLQSCTPVHL